MLFCIDIGNTNMVFGVTDGERILDHWRIRTEKDVTSDELGILIGNLFKSSRINISDITDIIISCVVPPLLYTVEEYALRYLKIKPLIVGPGLKTGMPIHYDNPKEVGADRIVNAVAAYEKYRTGLIIVDFGTATTFDAISSKGEYLGGAISPGIMIASEALFQKASKLPRVELSDIPETVIGKDTAASIKAGVIYGYTGLVDAMVMRMRAEMDGVPKVIATGGLATLIAKISTTIESVEPTLTLEGLRILSANV